VEFVNNDYYYLLLLVVLNILFYRCQEDYMFSMKLNFQFIPLINLFPCPTSIIF